MSLEQFSSVIASISKFNPVEIKKIHGGGNNRSYLCTEKDGYQFILKEYFYHPGDTRDRLGAEWRFLTLLSRKESLPVPKPLFISEDRKLAGYTFIPGEKLRSEEISKNHLEQALRFISEIQKFLPDAENTIKNGSEACWSSQEHIALIEQRINRLYAQQESSVQLKEFLEQKLSPLFSEVAGKVKNFTKSEKILSPSDFGFHNALAIEDKLTFLDFEYAGVDSPHKLICDFICQPAIPLPRAFYKEWLEGSLKIFKDAPTLNEEVSTLLPLYRIKWCCIILNNFLREGSARREFAQVQGEDFAVIQIGKAQAMLTAIEEDRNVL